MMKTLRFSMIVAILHLGVSAGAELPRGPNFDRVCLTDVQNGCAIGTTSNESVILRTHNGGNSWKIVYRSKSALYSIHFPSASEGWVVGRSGTVLHTLNGGETWRTEASGSNEDLYAVSADSAGLVFVAGKGSTLLRSRDNGENWIKLSMPVEGDLTDVVLRPSGTLLVLARNRLFTSTDSGATWTAWGPYESDTLSGMAFLTDKVGFLRSRLLFLTTDGGSTLTHLPISATDFVSAIKVTGTAAFLILGYAETGSTVILPGTKLPSHSTIMKSTDQGRTWQPLLELRDESTHTAWLSDLYFIGEHGLAVGDEGTVVLTEDGGRNWQHFQITPD